MEKDCPLSVLGCEASETGSPAAEHSILVGSSQDCIDTSMLQDASIYSTSKIALASLEAKTLCKLLVYWSL